MTGKPKKLVLAVVDALKPEMLDRAVAQGRAPALAALIERGVYIRDCVSTFPSVTPVASATIATGLGPDQHLIPAMNWWHRGEERYVEYGSSFDAARAFGILRQLNDLIYNMNLAHLTREHRTVFEHLDDAGLRTAGTTYLIYRGRTRHMPVRAGVYARMARIAQLRHGVWGPDELFYADIFESRATGCRSTLGLPGQRDQHAGCVGAHLVENDLFDFLLFSLPDNDSFSHKRGPYAQVSSIALADRALERIMHVAGGVDAFLEEHAIMVMSDHSQLEVQDKLNLAEALGSWRVLGPHGDPEDAEIAVSPSQRAAGVYALDPERRDEVARRVARDLDGVDGVDLVLLADNDAARVSSPRGQLRFAPGGELVDRRGESWDVEGDLDALELQVEDGEVTSRLYPDPLGRLWSALRCPAAGDVLVSLAPGYECVDWGGAVHIGGGSHGSLHRGDSLGALILCGTGPGSAGSRREWSLRDVTPMVLQHFSLPS